MLAKMVIDLFVDRDLIKGDPRNGSESGPGSGPGGVVLAQLRIQFPRAPVKYYVCQGAHIFEDCPTWLAIEDVHK